MVTQTFTIVGMNCQHCIGSVTEAVRGLADVRQVAVDLPSGELAVTTPDGTEPSLRPIYEGFAAKLRARHAGDDRPGKVTSFATIEDAVAHGPALVGTPERAAEKILDYHKAYRHDVPSVSVNAVLPFTQQQEVLQQFAEEVIPLVRREVSTTLWGSDDPGRAKGFAPIG